MTSLVNPLPSPSKPDFLILSLFFSMIHSPLHQPEQSTLIWIRSAALYFSLRPDQTSSIRLTFHWTRWLRVEPHQVGSANPSSISENRNDFVYRYFEVVDWLGFYCLADRPQFRPQCQHAIQYWRWHEIDATNLWPTAIGVLIADASASYSSTYLIAFGHVIDATQYLHQRSRFVIVNKIWPHKRTHFSDSGNNQLT